MLTMPCCAAFRNVNYRRSLNRLVPHLDRQSRGHGFESRQLHQIAHVVALVWDRREDAAVLIDSTGNLVETVHYRSKRTTQLPSRRSN